MKSLVMEEMARGMSDVPVASASAGSYNNEA